MTMVCEHKRNYTTDQGFVMCSDCEVILTLPQLTDLALAELERMNQERMHP